MPATSSPHPALIVLVLANAALLGGAGFLLWQVKQQQAANHAVLEQVHAEVTRFRIEQSVDRKGPAALLEKLRIFAPLLSSSRTTEPDFRSAQKEMDAVLRALGTLGADAWKPIVDRLDELQGDRDFDEVHQLLRAALRVDRKAGVQLLKEVLLGHRLPAARLRWTAARLLTEHDKPLAQVLLRQILLTESSRGTNPDRAANGAPVPDAAAFATTGFHNFVVHYVRTEDEKLEDTLLMVIGRAEHDRVTVLECIKALGERRSQRAVEPIERLYENPPLQQYDPLFQCQLLDALIAIRGSEAKPFLENALAKAATDTTIKHIRYLLDKIK